MRNNEFPLNSDTDRWLHCNTTALWNLQMLDRGYTDVTCTQFRGRVDGGRTWQPSPAGLGSLLQQAIFQTVFSTCTMASVAFSLQRVEQISICECWMGVASWCTVWWSVLLFCFHGGSWGDGVDSLGALVVACQCWSRAVGSPVLHTEAKVMICNPAEWSHNC